MVASFLAHFLGLFLLGCCLLKQLAGLTNLSVAWISIAVASVGALSLSRRQKMERLPAAVWLVAAALFLQVLIWQAGEIDDDYWIHTPVQALLQRGGWPPMHPLFPSIQLRGHFGRDLVIAELASAFQLYNISVQIWVTALAHSLSFVLLVAWMRTYALPQAALWLAVTLFSLGVCVGGRIGFLDCYQNNNSLAYAFTFLSLYCWRRWLLQGGRSYLELVLALTYLGVCYEMLWGLAVMTILCFSLASRRQLALVSAAVIAALSLTLLASGSLRPILLPSETPSGGDQREEIQHQVVHLGFPKKDLGMVFLSQHSSPVSIGFSLWPELRRRVSEPRVDQGQRVAILSYTYLRSHWFATWMAPFTLCWAWRRRNQAALSAGLLGAFSLMVPGLVDFGIFEHENFRWSYTAGAFFAIALGAQLGYSWSSTTRAGRVARLGLCSLIIAPCLLYYPYKIKQAWLQPLQRWAQATHGMTYYQAHSALNFPKELGQAALWLKANASAGQILLTDIPAPSFIDPWPECTLLGVCGLPSIGHAYPNPYEGIGTPPHLYMAWHRAFWASPSWLTARDQGVSWILRTRPDSGNPGSVLGFKPVGIWGNSTYLFGLDTPPIPQAGPHRFSVRRQGLEDGKLVGLNYIGWLDVASSHAPDDLGQVTCQVSFLPLDGEAKAESYRWSFLSCPLARVPIATPSQPGHYQARVTFSNDPDGQNTQVFGVFCRP